MTERMLRPAFSLDRIRLTLGCGVLSTPTRQERPRTTRNILSVSLADLQVIREQPGTVANIVILPYKEEVAGSNPASPTRKKWRFAGKLRYMI